MKNNTVEEMLREKTHLLQMSPDPDSNPWPVVDSDDVKKIITTLTQLHQDELREVYREILELTYEKDDMNEQVPSSLKNYGQAMGEMHQEIKALAQTRRIDISDKK